MGNVSQTDWAGFFGFVICACVVVFAASLLWFVWFDSGILTSYRLMWTCVIVAVPSFFAFKTLIED
jgi:cobalamin biosynthesis protein CobD/CbiB